MPAAPQPARSPDLDEGWGWVSSFMWVILLLALLFAIELARYVG